MSLSWPGFLVMLCLGCIEHRKTVLSRKARFPFVQAGPTPTRYMSPHDKQASQGLLNMHFASPGLCPSPLACSVGREPPVPSSLEFLNHICMQTVSLESTRLHLALHNKISIASWHQVWKLPASPREGNPSGWFPSVFFLKGTVGCHPCPLGGSCCPLSRLA